MSIPYLLFHSAHHVFARRRPSSQIGVHLANLTFAALFVLLAVAGGGANAGADAGAASTAGALRLARLLVPMVFFWWAYEWSGRCLHLRHPPEFSYDDAILEFEGRWLGQPSLWLARGKARWLNEAMNALYFSYYFYTPVLALVLYGRGALTSFEAMLLAVNLGYTICYSLYPFTPVWGPRWALVDNGQLPKTEQILSGYWITRFMNSIMYGGVAHRGGAMPSAHSSTALIFLVWCGRIWGLPGGLIGGAIAVGMWFSTVYGRYHYAVDVVVGNAIGLLALWIADALVLG